jgi:hypothetical protein
VTTVEVLAPVRLETRFVAPAQRADGVDQWQLRLRVYPDEFSVARTVAAPTPEELDRLQEAVGMLSRADPVDEAAAFASFASAVGAGRALGLWRRCVKDDGAGGLRVDRGGAAEHVPFQSHRPIGLPDRLEVWFVHADGTRTRAAELTPDTAAIAADLDVTLFGQDPAVGLLEGGTLPDTWWLSYQRAVTVGLGVDLDVGATPPRLDALVVVGIGATDTAELVDTHNAGNRLAILPAGTPTNTVAGEPTTDLGDHADTLYPLLHTDPSTQLSTVAVLSALTGRVPAAALPTLGGDYDYFGPGSLAVQALWPVLWGRSLRDVTGAGAAEVELARWAMRNLAVEAPRPAFRVGAQPYGLLPTSAFDAWTGEPGDALAPLEQRILAWALPWRAGAAAATRAANRRVPDADTAGLFAALGAHAPSRHWRVRPIADLPLIQASRALAGMGYTPATDWDLRTAAVWRAWRYPLAPIGPAARGGEVPGPSRDAVDDGTELSALIAMEPEPLYFRTDLTLGLVGHLVRESLICARAVLGEAVHRLGAGTPVDAGAALPLDDEVAYRNFVMQGGDGAATALQASADSNARTVAQRFREVVEALQVVADMYKQGDPSRWFRGVLAALDTAAFRVDPWLCGIAERRLQRMIDAGAPFRLGAYGWVDAPAPYDPGLRRAALPPGPTPAGLLHAPSPAQALTAALLRDAALRYPGDEHWAMTLDSAKIRAAIALAERVRLGVHPYEALGLEVEKVAGDWDSVRILRGSFPLGPDQQLRRVCDGAAVLRAARANALPGGLAPDLAERLAPLDDVLDTYADLLIADGVHALVTGRGAMANAAMEGAAGLGAPPQLEAIRTARAAATVRVTAWVLLPPGDGAGADPLAVADPGFAAIVGGADPDPMAGLLGGGEDQAVVPSLTGGAYEGLTAQADGLLRAEVFVDLSGRLGRLRSLAEADRAAAAVLDPGDPALAATAERWRITLPADGAQAALLAALDQRLADTATPPQVPAGAAGGGAAAVPDSAINAVRQMIRRLAGRPTLPILPIVDRALLPVLRPAPDLDRIWLEVVAAVRPRLAPLEAHQFGQPWTGYIAAPQQSIDPWSVAGPVLVAYAPPGPVPAPRVAIAALDAWTDSVPSRRHVTAAAFGFNAPKARAPQAVLLAVPPDVSQRLDNAGLLEVVLQTRELVHARATRPQDRGGLPYATPAPLVHAAPASVGFLNGWPP